MRSMATSSTPRWLRRSSHRENIERVLAREEHESDCHEKNYFYSNPAAAGIDGANRVTANASPQRWADRAESCAFRSGLRGDTQAGEQEHCITALYGKTACERRRPGAARCCAH